MEKISLVITVKNERRSLPALLQSIEAQTHLPDEVVICDGGSEDGSFTLLQQWKPRFSTTILQKSGNRSVGRNTAIEATHHPLIAITDAGCVPHNTWLEEIIAPFQHDADVVAGYYEAKANSPFERAAAAFMLVMPENIDEKNFLPATRSMAIRKSIWQKAGRFNEAFTFNEDYVFAKTLQKMDVKFAFVRKAIVFWQPPQTWQAFFLQVYKFAFGDAFAGILRPKVALLYARYIAFLFLLAVSRPFALIFAMLYIAWSIAKHIRHVQSSQALLILPIMQIGTDITVMCGTLVGCIQKAMNVE